MLERAYHISGKAEDVDAATAGMRTYHTEKLGRSKGVTVLMPPGKVFQASAELSVQPMSLQQVFVALCGKEEN